MQCWCAIVPTHVLTRLSLDQSLSDARRKAFANAAAYEMHWRTVRSLHAESTVVASQSLSAPSPPPVFTPPAVMVYDCAEGTALPGSPISHDPAASPESPAARAHLETTAVAEFYGRIFGRNSLDGRGLTLQSSIRYGTGYNNAFWNGQQMIYGDGDGHIFGDFTQGRDVIAHELTHGITQHTAQLSYTGEAGGLNESISDAFGSMFRQWRANQAVTEADWLIGKDVMGPGALEKGHTCLRDLSNPGADHCLAAQPTHYSQLKPGLEAHSTSGVPNFAFYKAALAIGGKSWETAGQVWYRALTDFAPDANLSMRSFADRTRQLAQRLFPATPSVQTAIDKAWTDVGL